MRKAFEVGYENEMIGIYHGNTPEEAIRACKSHMLEMNFKPDTPVMERLKGLIANPVSKKKTEPDQELGV